MAWATFLELDRPLMTLQTADPPTFSSWAMIAWLLPAFSINAFKSAE
jgi:hypothetical protein